MGRSALLIMLWGCVATPPELLIDTGAPSVLDSGSGLDDVESLSPGVPRNPEQPLAGCRVETWMGADLVGGRPVAGRYPATELTYDDAGRALVRVQRFGSYQADRYGYDEQGTLATLTTEVGPWPDDGDHTSSRSTIVQTFGPTGDPVEILTYEGWGDARVPQSVVRQVFDERGAQVRATLDHDADGEVDEETVWERETLRDDGSGRVVRATRRRIRREQEDLVDGTDETYNEVGQLVRTTLWAPTPNDVDVQWRWEYDGAQQVRISRGLPSADDVLQRWFLTERTYEAGALLVEVQSAGDEANGEPLSLERRYTYVNDAEGRPLLELTYVPGDPVPTTALHTQYHQTFDALDAADGPSLVPPPATEGARPTQTQHVGPDGILIGRVLYGYTGFGLEAAVDTVYGSWDRYDPWGRFLRRELRLRGVEGGLGVEIDQLSAYGCP